MIDLKVDCRFYRGEKPCKFKRLCSGCSHYKPMGTRILLIKLGALGDALRTTPLLYALKKKFPVNYITWLTDTGSMQVLKNNPYIDRLINIDSRHVLNVLSQEFDILFSLDKDSTALAIAMQATATYKKGYSMTQWGTLHVFNDSAAYSLALGLDDSLKFHRNQKTYQETIYEIAELPFHRDHYIYSLQSEDKREAVEILANLKTRGSGPKIGLNIGCGPIFATKKWSDELFIELALLLNRKLDAQIFLLGGEDEQKSNQEIQKKLNGSGVNTGVHSLDIFAGILSEMDLVVTSDTMALHLTLAVKTKVVVLFGPTCHQEVDLYEIGKSIVSTTDCTPCYLSKCPKDITCMSLISPADVFQNVCELLER